MDLPMVDRISDFPDEILCHVLSFLPTEEAVTTRVLSLRWKPLWPSVSTLKFDKDHYLRGNEWRQLWGFGSTLEFDQDGGKRSRSDSDFVEFVYSAIGSRDLHQPIKHFTLNTGYDLLYSDVKAWLIAAIKCQVENLEISFPDSAMPECILECETLVVLKLRDAMVGAFSSVKLPSLKTLHMYGVKFLKPQFLIELLHGCPLLEDLEIHDISFHDSVFEGEVQILSNLVRAKVFFNGNAFHIPVKAFCNVQSLTIDKCDTADISVFPNLTYLELSFRRSLKWNMVLDMLNHCPKLQTLVFELIGDDENEVWPDPVVPECFSSHLRKCFLKDFKGLDCQMTFAKYVLQNSTSLRTMTISCRNYRQKVLRKELAPCLGRSAGCELLFK